MPPLVPLVRVEFHSLGLGVSVSPLVTLISFRIDVDSFNLVPNTLQTEILDTVTGVYLTVTKFFTCINLILTLTSI